DVAGVDVDRCQGPAQFCEPAGEQPGSGADLEDRTGGVGRESTEVGEGGAVREQLFATFVWSARESAGHGALQVVGRWGLLKVQLTRGVMPPGWRRGPLWSRVRSVSACLMFAAGVCGGTCLRSRTRLLNGALHGCPRPDDPGRFSAGARRKTPSPRCLRPPRPGPSTRAAYEP